jgi:hypothetical protein
MHFFKDPVQMNALQNANTQNFAPFHNGTTSMPFMAMVAALRMVCMTKETGGAG